MAASHFKLDNITVIIDNNNFQQTGSNETIMSLGDLNSKWKSFQLGCKRDKRTFL